MPLKLTTENGRHVVTVRDAAGRVMNTVGTYATREAALSVMRDVNRQAEEAAERQTVERQAAEQLAESNRIVRSGGQLTREERDRVWAAESQVPGTNAYMLAQLVERSG